MAFDVAHRLNQVSRSNSVSGRSVPEAGSRFRTVLSKEERTSSGNLANCETEPGSWSVSMVRVVYLQGQSFREQGRQRKRGDRVDGMEVRHPNYMDTTCKEKIQLSNSQKAGRAPYLVE